MEAGGPTGFPEEQAARNPFLVVEEPPALTGRCRRMGRVPKTHPRRLPDGKIILTRRNGGLPFRANKEMHRVSRPGGGKVPAIGRPGALAPGGPVAGAARGRGGGPGQTA